MTEQLPPFIVDVALAGDRHTIALSGEMDMAASPRFAAAVAAIPEDRSRTVLIDLSGVTFIDSSGLQALLAAEQECRARGHELRVVPGPANVHRLFEITGMSETLPFTDPVP